jgi:hypothetical protein
VCFSATASFGASAVLGGIGAWTVSSSARGKPLALIPLLFAAQQASEGALWLVLERSPWGVSNTPLVTVFLFFALAVWPVYIPFSLLLLETSRARKTLLKVALAAGVVIGCYLMLRSTIVRPSACIAVGNLYYGIQVDASLKPFMPFAYAATIVFPLLVSSFRGTTVLAIVMLLSFLIIGFLYPAGFTSVWCFFAAMLSGVTAMIVRAKSR